MKTLESLGNRSASPTAADVFLAEELRRTDPQKERYIMLKKILFASVAALGLAVPASVPATANAGYYHHCCYEVLYRSCPREGWRCEGTFESHYRADEVAHHLRHRGFEVRIVER
jgi:hypothetical protein